MRLIRSIRRAAAVIFRSHWLACGAALLLLSGCIVVPLPGIKGGGIADEKTKSTLPPGTPLADVLLRLGEPDSVSATGRRIAYTWRRTWAVGAVGGYGGAFPFVVMRGSAVVLTFDSNDRLVGAENVSRWLEHELDDTTLFYSANAAASAGPEASDSWEAHWYIFTDRDRFCVKGRTFLTMEGLSLRPEHTLDYDGGRTALIPWADVSDLEFFGNGLSFARAATGQRFLVLTGAPLADGMLREKQLAENVRRYGLANARWQRPPGLPSSPRPLSLRSAMYQLLPRGGKISSLWQADGNQWCVLSEHEDQLVLFAPQLPRGTLAVRFADLSGGERLQGTFTTRVVFTLPDGRRLVLGPSFGKALSPDAAAGPVAQPTENPVDHYLARWQAARARSAH